VLTRLQFFRALEWIVVRTTGAAPRAEDLGNLAAGRRASAQPVRVPVRALRRVHGRPASP